MLYYKTINHLLKSHSYFIDIIIKRYNQPASDQTIQPLQAIKKALYTSVYNALLIHAINRIHSIVPCKLDN